MQLQAGIFPVVAKDFPRVVAVWEASVRATHDFVSEADIRFFKPLVRDALPQFRDLVCLRDTGGEVAGFVGVAQGTVEMLFIHPAWHGHGGGRRLLDYAVTQLGAMMLDVNEQNAQAVAFYQHLGFEVIGRSARDGTNKPYPLMHMRRSIS